MADEAVCQLRQECSLKDRLVRQDKIVHALMDRAEQATATRNSDFALFQSTILLEEQVRRRTQELRTVLEERKAAELQIKYLAQHDPLTGLPNRTQLHAAFRRELAMSRRDNFSLAVLWIDLDRFKGVNDLLGHQAGDLLLRKVAERLEQNVRESDIVARIGGDEFVLLQTMVTQFEQTAGLAARLIEKLSQPFDLDGSQVVIGASIGIAMAPQDGTNADALLQDADTALYRAKSEGRGTFCFFQSGMDVLLRERRELEQDIAHAVANDEFELAFQPLFAGTSSGVVEGGAVDGFEALLRWPHPTRGLISPDGFIPLAEETGLIVPIGRWVLETACREAASWPMPYSVAINVSAQQFSGGNFAGLVADVLARTGLEPARLEIEITETLLIKDGATATAALRELKALGVRIALDDFGTGYSSLSYLQRFPFNRVKIDKSFIDGLTCSEDARAIVNAILALSHQLRLKVTAEGVETQEQLDMLQAQRCDQIQGFLLARPIPQRDVVGYISRQTGAGG